MFNFERGEPKGESPVEGLSPGTFRAEFTGTVTTVLEGVASFSSSEDEGGFVLSLAALGPDGINLHRHGAGRPSPGSHPVMDFQAAMFGSDGFWCSVFLTDGADCFSARAARSRLPAPQRRNSRGRWLSRQREAKQEASRQKVIKHELQ
ncbi:hypothetical protein [Aquisalimonas sp.]|uniref:hypothetical protein n=1 Tax=Aquisalimonas sp. TaxID=1872621 RepID=UPI0025B7B658|nr:hypothetical protein [Aquisalimonas sp.]